MKTLILGITITTVAVLLTALVCFIFARIAIVSIHNEYSALLKKRDEELLAKNKDLRFLSERVAELETMTALERVNEPQAEFFTVPRGKR